MPRMGSPSRRGATDRRRGRVRPVRTEIGERRWSMLDEAAQEWIMGESMRERWEPEAVGRMLHGWVQRG